MADLFMHLFGVQNHLTPLQEVARAGLIFCYGLVLLRASGSRLFGHWSALDIVVTIMVGSALARAMTGGAPLVGTMAATAVLAALHVALAHCVARNAVLSRIIEGEALVLVDHGRIDHSQRVRSKISEADLQEALRAEGVDGEEHMGNVKSVTLEPSGNISVIKIDPCKQDLT